MRKLVIVSIVLVSANLLSTQNQAVSLRKQKILQVPLAAQESDMWCWAACTQMILEFMGEQVPQCKQVNLSLELSNCCNSPTPDDCDESGWPEFYRYGFSSDSVDAPLSWQQLKTEIDNNRPIAFSWAWKQGGGHMMVAVGYAEPHWVYVNNPWPPSGDSTRHEGDHQIITYSEYVRSADHDHYRDYYNIRPKPEQEEPEITERTEDAEGTPHAEIDVSEVTTSGPSPELAASTDRFVAFDKRPEPIGGFKAIQRALKYPPKAREAGWKGKVVINALVDKNGRVADTEVLQTSGHAILDQAAIDAIKSTKWNPAMQRDKAVDVWVAIPLNFKVR